jgi:predicted SAM-dependent methyltransferase
MHGGILDSKNYEDETFDVITSFEVIEHINNPLEETAHIQKIMRKGGLFYCTTPNFNSLMRYYLKADYNVIEYPEHLSYYTSKTLTYLMNKFGFEKQKVLTTGISITRFKGSQDSKKEKEASQENNIENTTPEPQQEKAVGEALVTASSADEILRNKIENNPLLQFGKTLANGTLNLTNTGLTLKGYYIKK